MYKYSFKHTSFSVNSGGGLVVTTRSNDIKSLTSLLLLDSTRTVKDAANPSVAFIDTNTSIFKSIEELYGTGYELSDASRVYSIKSAELPIVDMSTITRNVESDKAPLIRVRVTV